MSQYHRLIKFAFDRISQRTIEADNLFDIKKDAFEIRKQSNRDEFDFVCPECDQSLEISSSKYDRLHFRHGKGAEYCVLKDDDLSPEQREKFTLNLRFKESERHYFLKNRIADLLRTSKGVDPSSIRVDDHFIIKGSDKRRPDVYCLYENKQIVFEIQLSNLSLRYILSRYDFYRKHEIYLIWILDDFDAREGQGQMEKDIKYLTEYHNFFKLDESLAEFRLICDYKYAFLTSTNLVHTAWTKKSISLKDLNFDSDLFQVYFYNLAEKKEAQEKERIVRLAQFNELEQKRLEERAIQNTKVKSEEIIQHIKELRQRNFASYSSVEALIAELEQSEVPIFNQVLKISNTEVGKTPALHYWLNFYKDSAFSFFVFLLTTLRIHLNVNELSPAGESTLMKIYTIKGVPKTSMMQLILKRSYIFTEEDEEFLKNIGEEETQIILYRICSRLTIKRYVDDVFTHEKRILIIESAKQNRLIGFNFKGPGAWIAFANNAIEYHSEYWEYIEIAFKYYGLWNTLIDSDGKGTFQKKLHSFYQNIPKQNYDFESVFKRVFPEFASYEQN